MMDLFGANAASRTCAFLFQLRQGMTAPLVTPTALHNLYHYHSRRRGLLPSNVVVAHAKPFSFLERCHPAGYHTRSQTVDAVLGLQDLVA